MTSIQHTILLLFALINLGVAVKGFDESLKKRTFVLCYALFPLGMFVWGDAALLGIFWIAVSLVSVYFQNWILFCLLFWVFWIIRSLGETMYWFIEQFSSSHRNPPHTLPGNRIFHDDAIWFAYQVIWQCVSVFSIVFTIYFARLWVLGMN